MAFKLNLPLENGCENMVHLIGNQSNTIVAKTPEQRILELEAKVKLLERQKARAEHLAECADKKVIICS